MNLDSPLISPASQSSVLHILFLMEECDAIHQKRLEALRQQLVSLLGLPCERLGTPLLNQFLST